MKELFAMGGLGYLCAVSFSYRDLDSCDENNESRKPERRSRSEEKLQITEHVKILKLMKFSLRMPND